MNAAVSSARQAAAARLAVARRLLAEQQGIAATLGSFFSGSTTLELLLILYIAHENGDPIATGDVIAAVGPAPAVTWRWIQTLLDDGLIATEGRSSPMTLTARGVDRVTTTLDVVIAVS